MLAVCLGISFALNVLLTVLVFKLSATFADKLERAHQRTTEYTKDLLDRLMTNNWSEYRTYITAEGIDEEVDGQTAGLQLEPVLGPDRGGFGSRLGLRAYGLPEEDEIDPERDMP